MFAEVRKDAGGNRSRLLTQFDFEFTARNKGDLHTREKGREYKDKRMIK